MHRDTNRFRLIEILKRHVLGINASNTNIQQFRMLQKEVTPDHCQACSLKVDANKVGIPREVPRQLY